MDFLRDLDFDRTSFWIGFLAGFLFMWLLGRLRPAFGKLVGNIRNWFVIARQSATAGADVRLRNEALRRAQSIHLAAPLFPLDEVLITPKVLAPPVRVFPGETPPPTDITHQVLPYLPDMPEMAARYRAPTFTLDEALQNVASLVIIGSPGSGKSVALAHLASQMARRENLPGELEKLTPLLIHAGDFSLPSENMEALLDPLISCLGMSSAVAKKSRLNDFLEWTLSKGNLLLILDGLDELPPAKVDEVTQYLELLKDQYQLLRIVAGASLEYYDGLTHLGCAPLAMAGWDRIERAAFIERWRKAWMGSTAPLDQNTQVAEPALINAWLISDHTPATPLEITLKTWAAYAGDQLGTAPTDAIEAYLRRMVFDKNLQPVQQARPALEQIALHMVVSNQPALTRAALGVSPASVISSEVEPAIENEEISEADEPAERVELAEPDYSLPEALSGIKRVKVSPVLPMLLENGLLVGNVENRLKFNHPIICSYLAGYALSELVGVDAIFSGEEWIDKPGWETRIQTIGFAIARGNPVTKVIEKHLDHDHQPLHEHILKAARWLRYAPSSTPWRSQIMRRLAALLQDPSEPLALRARVIAAMVNSRASGFHTFMHQLCQSSIPGQRQVAALSAGLYYDDKIAAEKTAVDSLLNDLNDMLIDPSPNVRRAACLALVAIGNRTALEYVADALLSGDEELRQAAAEALANHPEEGHPLLREGTQIDDLLVRRAVIFGIQRVDHPWAVEALNKIQIEEEEWLVKNAATQALETMAQPDPYLPQPFPPLTETAWLIEYAGEKGIGVSPGKPAVELLLTALADGTEEQKLAALDYLCQFGDELAIRPLYQLLDHSQGEVQDATFNALWHMAVAGVSIPQQHKISPA